MTKPVSVALPSEHIDAARAVHKVGLVHAEDLMELVAHPLQRFGAVEVELSDRGCEVRVEGTSLLKLPPPGSDRLRLELKRLEGAVVIGGRSCFVSHVSNGVRLSIDPPPPPPPIARDVELERAIAETGDRDAYLVYGDYLQEQGDPRGELISLQATDDPRAKRTAELLIEREREYFLGLIANPRIDVRWRLGFIERARIHLDGLERPGASELLRALLDHPSSRFLHRLEIAGGLTFRLEDAALRSIRHDRLHTLILTAPSEDLGLLAKNLPELRTLEVRAGFDAVSRGEFRSLESLLIALPEIALKDLRKLRQAAYPRLESIKIRVTPEIDSDYLVFLFLRSAFPSLKRIAIKDARDPRAVERRLREIGIEDVRVT